MEKNRFCAYFPKLPMFHLHQLQTNYSCGVYLLLIYLAAQHTHQQDGDHTHKFKKKKKKDEEKTKNK